MDDSRMVSCFSDGSVAGAYDDIYLPRIFIPWARLAAATLLLHYPRLAQHVTGRVIASVKSG